MILLIVIPQKNYHFHNSPKQTFLNRCFLKLQMSMSNHKALCQLQWNSMEVHCYNCIFYSAEQSAQRSMFFTIICTTFSSEYAFKNIFAIVSHPAFWKKTGNYLNTWQTTENLCVCFPSIFAPLVSGGLE